MNPARIATESLTPDPELENSLGQNRPFRPVPLNDCNTLKSGNQEPERRLITAKRKSPHVFPDFRLVPKGEVEIIFCKTEKQVVFQF